MTLAYIINSLLFVVPCILLLLLVFWDQLKTPTILRIFIDGSVFLTISFWGTYIYFLFGTPLHHLLISAASMFSGVLIFSSACKYNFWQSLFIIEVVNSYSENIRFLSMDLYYLMNGELPRQPILPIAFITTLLTLLTFPAIWLFYRHFMRPALDYTVSLSVWKWVWLIPVSNNAVYTVTIAPEYSRFGLSPEDVFFPIPPFWVLLTFSTYGILLKMMIDVSKNAVLQENLHLSETQIAAQQKQMELLQSNIQETRRFRHDMQHHFLAMEGFLGDHDLEGLKTYVRQSAAIFPARQTETFCCSAAVNALLSYYLEQEEKEHVDISVNAALSDPLPIPDAELCIVIGNLLENAVEAHRRMKPQERFLDISLSMPSRSILTIQVCNNYEGAVRQTADGAFLSSKRKDRKGIGLSSVLSITEKYHGIARIEYQNQIFKVSVIISQYP